MIRDFAPVMFPDLAPDGLVEWAGGKAHGLFARWAVDPTSVEGLVDEYALPNTQVMHVTVDPGLRTGFWRSVGHSFNAFAKECFMDELALAAGMDPLDFRLVHLPATSRMQAVLKKLARDRPLGQSLGARPLPGHCRAYILWHRGGADCRGVGQQGQDYRAFGQLRGRLRAGHQPADGQSADAEQYRLWTHRRFAWPHRP